MRMLCLICGALAVNTYIVGSDDTEECAVIDPGEAEPVLSALEERSLKCTHILLTHGHFDHIGGVAALCQSTGARVAVHEADAPMLESGRLNLAALTGRMIRRARADTLLLGGETLEIAGLTIRVLHTPGHTKGGVCYALERERAVFCGDTLFRGGAGRTDFPGGSAKELYRSITDRLFSLDGDYALFCGHGEDTTLEHERESNPFVLRARRFGW